MKYALIGDIHANLPAFRGVLNDAKKQGVDGYIFLGDYCTCFPYDNEVLAAICSCPNAYFIKGNHEDYLLDRYPQKPALHSGGQFEAVDWACKHLTENNFFFLQGLPRQISIETSGAPTIYAAHRIEDWIQDTVLSELTSCTLVSGVEQGAAGVEDIPGFIHRLIAGDKQLEKQVCSLPPGVYVAGHTHVQWQWAGTKHLFINPGACGLALDFSPRAAYAVLEQAGEGWSAGLKQIEYDFNLLYNEPRYIEYAAAVPVWAHLIRKELETASRQVNPFLSFAEQYATEIEDLRRPFTQETWNRAFEAYCASLKGGCP